MKKTTAIVIPARLESSRFPEKMLVKVTDQHCLIQRVEHWCKMVTEHVYVATDSKKIAALFPDNAIMTSRDCLNGTERVAEAALQLTDYKNFINVQGDMIDPPIGILDDIDTMLSYYDVATVVTEMDDKSRADPNTVKCINNGEEANWFLRAPLDYGDWHLGVYGYRRRALVQYKEFDKHEPEFIESLEQLRWLTNSKKIGITWSEELCGEINTPEDLENWQLTHQN